MTRRTKMISRAGLAGLAGLFIFVGGEQFPLLRSPSLVTQAYAIIGRPLTPMSYAGVARRTTRREAYAYGAAAGAVAAAPYAYGAGCYQAVDPYGRVYTRCP